MMIEFEEGHYINSLYVVSTTVVGVLLRVKTFDGEEHVRTFDSDGDAESRALEIRNTVEGLFQNV